MINKILKSSAIPSWPGRCPVPPECTYGIYFDAVEADGPDGETPRIFTHDITIELYAPTQEAASTAEAALESAIGAQGLTWTKQDRYWLSSVQRYQTIYEFTYITKI